MLDDKVMKVLREDNSYLGLCGPNNYLGVPFSDIRLNQLPEFRIGDSFQDYINRNWQSEVTKNPAIFDSPLVGTVPTSFRVVDGTLIIDVYPSSFKNMLATSRAYVSRRSLHSIGHKGLFRFIHNDQFYLLFGIRNPNQVNIGGSIQAMPAGFLDLEDLTLANPLNETLKREYLEEVEQEGESMDKKREREALSTYDELGKIFMGISWVYDYGNVDADTLLSNIYDGWVGKRHSISSGNGVVQIQKKRGRFAEHKVVIGVPQSDLADFIIEKNNHISIASRWLLRRAIELNEISI